jgi:hypothetical protein
MSNEPDSEPRGRRAWLVAAIVAVVIVVVALHLTGVVGPQ